MFQNVGSCVKMMDLLLFSQKYSSISKQYNRQLARINTLINYSYISVDKTIPIYLNMINRQVQNQKGLIQAHKIFDFPICSLNNNYEHWQYLDKSIRYQYIVNGLKYQNNKKQFRKTPEVYKEASSILSILTVQLYVNQLKPIRNFIERVFPNLQKLIILLIEVHPTEKEMEKIKNFISSFERLKKVKILLKMPKIKQQISFKLGRFWKIFRSLNIPFAFAMYQSKIGFRYKKNTIIYKDTFPLLTLLEDAGDNFETLIGFLNQVGQNQLMKQISRFSEWHCIEILNMQTQHSPSILISIKNLQLKYLRSLTITRTSIETIQGLTYLKAPHLKKLYLAQNKVSCVSPLGKLKFTELKSICLFQNMIQDHQPIIHGDQGSLEQIRLSSMTYQQFIPENIGYFAKLQHRKFYRHIKDYNNMNRILKEVLKKKSQNKKKPKQQAQLMELDD